MKKAIDGTKIVFTFDGLDSVVFDTENMSAENKAYAVPFGMSHRFGDNAAIARKDKDGNIINVTEAMRRAAIVEMKTHYESMSAEWNLKASRAPAQNPVFLDIATKRNCTYAEAEAWYATNLVAEMQRMIDAEQASK